MIEANQSYCGLCTAANNACMCNVLYVCVAGLKITRADSVDASVKKQTRIAISKNHVGTWLGPGGKVGDDRRLDDGCFAVTESAERSTPELVWTVHCSLHSLWPDSASGILGREELARSHPLHFVELSAWLSGQQTMQFRTT